jgi:hypothetical protein
MSDDLIRKILDEEIPAEEGYEQEREDSLGKMVLLGFRSVWKGPLRSYIVTAWSFILAFMAIAVWMAFLYFRTDDLWYMILYATIFNACIVIASVVRSFLWQIFHRTIQRNMIERNMRRLELRIIELAKLVEEGRKSA